MKKILFSLLVLSFLSSCSILQNNPQIPSPDTSTQTGVSITNIGTGENIQSSDIVDYSGSVTDHAQTGNAPLFPTDYTTTTTVDENLEGWGGPIYTTMIHLGDYIVQLQDTQGCIGRYTSQVVNDASGKTIDLLPYSDIPQKIRIGNVDYVYGSDNIQFSNHVFHMYMGAHSNLTMTGISIRDADNIHVQTLVDAESNGKLTGGDYYMPDEIYIQFQEFPIYFSYKRLTDIPSSFLVIRLTSDEARLIGTDGKLRDLPLTEKLIGQYTSNTVGGKIEGFVEGTDRKYTTERDDSGMEWRNIVMGESDLPVVALTKLDDNGYYSLSLLEPYHYVQYAEFCKPAIYVYTPISQHQSVTIVPISSLAFFTKTIPNFDSKNTWNYTTNPSIGDIVGSDKQAYPYLYYSIKVPNYEFNTDGWQVKGNDIIAFFHDKLNKIGFNTKEKSDFIEYWRELYDDPNAYYFVSFKYNEEIDQYVTLNFNKTPASQSRVLLESFKLPKSFENDYYKYENVGDKFDKYLIKIATRNSEFDVFEWGGVFYRGEKEGFVMY